MSTLPAAKKPSEARQRLLATASTIFYRDGIHSVGVDRVIAEAGVTRATFYRHFPGKEDLVLAYLQAEDTALRDQFAAVSALALDGERLLEVIIESIADDVSRNHTRGCPFINASAEYPDADSRVRVAIRSHREWFKSTLAMALESAARPNPEAGASALVLLRDAALVGGYLDGPDAMRDTFVATSRAVAGLS